MVLDLSLQMCRYLTALLNSKAVRFYFLKRFNTVKILRSHLESLPLPNPDEDCLKFFEPLCSELEQRGINDAGLAFDKLQDKIFDLYGMTFDRGLISTQIYLFRIMKVLDNGILDINGNVD